jgi:drug/metabolite transporter (DMT)-like permease
MQAVKPVSAALSILTAMLLIGFIDNFVVVLAETGSLWLFHAARTAIAIPLLVGLAWAFGWRILPKNTKPVMIRSTFASTAMMIYFGALALLPITQAVAGLFTSPLFVLLISATVFREPVGPARLLAAPIGFLGVLLVLQPWGDATSPVALFAMAAGFFYAVAMITTRRSCGGETTLTLLAAFFLIMGVWGCLGLVTVSLIGPSAPPGPDGFVLRAWGDPNGAFVFWTVVQAIGSLIAVAFITRAYQIGEASFVAIFEYSVLIFAAVWAYTLRGTVPGAVEFSGILLILSAGGILAIGDRRQVLA